MFCVYCGKQIPTNSKFCTFCGNQLPSLDMTKNVGKITNTDDTVPTLPAHSYTNIASSTTSNYTNLTGSTDFSIGLLFLSGVAGIIAFFLPFFSINLLFTQIDVSGFTILKAILTAFNIIKSIDGQAFLEFMQRLLREPESLKAFIGISVILFMIIGPLAFFVKSIRFVFAIAGEGYKTGARFAVVYTLICFAVFYLVGDEVGIPVSFFSITGIGYWLSIGAMIGGKVFKEII